jgi:hypothetical protein
LFRAREPGAPAEGVAPASNGAFDVERLFVVDGCTMYRFYDGLRPIYFARCDKSTTASRTVTESCGKGCSRERTEITTTDQPQ